MNSLDYEEVPFPFPHPSRGMVKRARHARTGQDTAIRMVRQGLRCVGTLAQPVLIQPES